MMKKQINPKDKHSLRGERGLKTRSHIIETMKKLLIEKEYISITTSEVAKRAGVNEGLIYHYFESKDDLFWSVVEEYMFKYVKFVEIHIQGAKGALNKIRNFIWANIYMLSKGRVRGKLLLLEVRNNPQYYKTKAYALSVTNSSILLNLINEGIASGEISETINPYSLRNTIIGALEHAVLPIIIHEKNRDVDVLTDQICEIIFSGITRKDDMMTSLIKKVDSIEKEIKKLTIERSTES